MYDSENRVVDSVAMRLSIPEASKVAVTWGQSPRPTNRNRIPFIYDKEESVWKLLVDRKNPRFCENCEVYVLSCLKGIDWIDYYCSPGRWGTAASNISILFGNIE